MRGGRSGALADLRDHFLVLRVSKTSVCGQPEKEIPATLNQALTGRKRVEFLSKAKLGRQPFRASMAEASTDTLTSKIPLKRLLA
jgi:hypothetical protein